MFYSETLLSKTGPLARVWLSANQERKLKKNDILQSNIESSVNVIVDQGPAPLALRLTGQLLLGVVRIYSRKAQYLFEDCNDAIIKIRMAFRPINVDLPVQAHTADSRNLILPDVITELDLLAPIPDASFLLDDDFNSLAPGQESSLLDFGSSQRLLSNSERTRRASTEPGGLLPDLDLGLDTGDDIFALSLRERSVEAGRDAPPRRTIQDEMDDTTALYDGPPLELDFGETELMQPEHEPNIVSPRFDEDGDVQMEGLDDGIVFSASRHTGGNAELELDTNPAAITLRNQKHSLSPLSSLRSSIERNLDQTFQQERESIVDEIDDEETLRHAQKAKRRKVIQADSETEMRSSDIRALQSDRSKILKPTTFLPRDPTLLALIQLQSDGNFVSSILRDGRQRGLAPELRGILSLEVVRKSAELKRKRDAGILPTPSPEAEMDIDVRTENLEDLSRPGAAFDSVGDTTLEPKGYDMAALEEQDVQAPNVEQADIILAREQLSTETHEPFEFEEGVMEDHFDETVAPILHPADSGPISLGTKHAVHTLREQFGSNATSTSTPSKRAKASVLFQDMLPQATKTRAEATKFFFEILVLATKDAIKVEQVESVLDGPIRIRAKRGLWGDWVEESINATQDANVAPS